MKIRKPSDYMMRCPYCGVDIIFKDDETRVLKTPKKYVEGLSRLTKLFMREKMLDVEYLRCPQCHEDIQLRITEWSDWDYYNYPIRYNSFEIEEVKND